MEQTQHAKRSRRTAAEIKQLLEDFKQGGSNATDFCKSIGISEAAFYKWRSRYAEKPALEQNGFVNLQALCVAGNESGLFAAVRGIKIYQVVSAQYLKELLG